MMITVNVYSVEPDINYYFRATVRSEQKAAQALKIIAANWRNSYSALIFDLARFMSPQFSDHPSARIRMRLVIPFNSF